MQAWIERLGPDLVGRVSALSAAMTWAVALVLFKKSGETVHPIGMNLFKNIIGTSLLAVTLVLLGESWSTLGRYPVEDIYLLIISGFLGLALADTLFFYSLNLVGVSLFAIVDCTYSPIVLLVSWLLIAEKLTLVHSLGGLLILGGLLVATRHPPPADRTRRQIIAGVLLGVLSIALMAVGIVIAKPVLETDGFPLVWATTIRLMAGTAALAAIAAASPLRRRILSAFRPAPVWGYSVPGSVFGGYLAMTFWVGGFKYTSATIAAVLNQTSAIFAIILAAIFLKERITPRKAVAIGMAICGVVLVTLGEAVDQWVEGWEIW